MSRPIQRTTVTVVTASRGVHYARMVDRLVSLLLGVLRERSSWMILAKAPVDISGMVVRKGVIDVNPPYIHRIFIRREVFY